MEKENRDYSLEKGAEKYANNFFKYDYEDRGMLKWRGFFLSDNTAALKREKNKPKVTLKKQQALGLISKRLKLSWQYKRSVVLQLKQFTSSIEIVQIQGIVLGYSDNLIILRDSNGVVQEVGLEEIRNCDLV